MLDFGVIGMAVMGRSLALNVADRGFRVGVWNRDPKPTAEAVAESGGRLVGAATLDELVAGLARPRRILVMIKAGAPVDAVLAQLRPKLEPGDIVIDGGNSLFRDTERREKELAPSGLRFFGMGISGGEDGARHGPSLMPGGDREAYAHVRPILEAIAAKTDSGPCVAHCGPGGAGHFVKMVHNGIEYADMQFIAEAYHVLSALGGLGPAELGDVFARYNQGPLESFLIEITAKIFRVKDPEGAGYLVDQVLDQAAQKGTGRWTAEIALELGVSIPSIAAAIDARVLSAAKARRVEASRRLSGPTATRDPGGLVDLVHDALYAAKIVGYAQGLDLMHRASTEYGWGMDLGEMARIWKGGCIIRARFLDSIMRAYARDRALPHLLFDAEFSSLVGERQGALRTVVSRALAAGIPLPGMSSSLAYYDSLRSAELPQNLTQAQRDAFGAHTYQRKGAPDVSIHTDWLG